MNPKNFELKPRHKWFQNNRPDAAEDWAGPFDSMENAICAGANEQLECSGEIGVIWVAQGRPSTKAERDEFGVDWKWWVEPTTAIPIQLTDKPTKPESVQWDYGTWINQLRSVDHISDSQLARLGTIIAHRLRYRSIPELTRMIHDSTKELQNQVYAEAGIPGSDPVDPLQKRTHAYRDGKVLPASVGINCEGEIQWNISGIKAPGPSDSNEDPKYFIHSMNSTFQLLAATTDINDANMYCACNPAAAVIETRPNGLILIASKTNTTVALEISGFIPKDPQ